MPYRKKQNSVSFMILSRWRPSPNITKPIGFYNKATLLMLTVHEYSMFNHECVHVSISVNVPKPVSTMVDG